MAAFDPSKYVPSFAPLLDPDRLPELGTGTPAKERRSEIAALTIATAFSEPVASKEAARCCLAGVWLLHDFLDESHRISQEMEGDSNADYWHGIMHRREPDPSNAKYWFHHVGEHPIFADLAAAARELGYQSRTTRWNPSEFIDRGWACPSDESEEGLLLRRVQRAEWNLLFDWCSRQAIGRK